MNYLFTVWTPVFANSLDAFVPEIWAQEGLLLLENSMVAGNLVHRDFENQIANFGDIVNTRLPASFTGKRKTDADSVTVQDATVTNVAVPLDQHLHTSFLVKDGEESKGFQNLRENLLAPAMLSLAQMVDEVVLSQVYQFLGNNVGQLGVAPTKSTIIALNALMHTNKVPMQGRNLILSPDSEADFLGIELFTAADKVGDGGTALSEAMLGRKFGVNTYMSQNTPSVATGSTVLTDLLVNNAAGYAAGTTTLTIDGRVGGTAIQNGSWIQIDGDDIPQRVTASVGAGTPTSITITPGLKRAVLNNAQITEYVPGQVNLGAGYAAGYSKDIVIDGFTVAPKIGQLISLGVAGTDAVYGALSTPTTTALLLDRPLAAAHADDAYVCPGPAGNYNFAFHRNAMALVTRPLAAPQAGTGALSFVASYNGLSMRVTITYDGSQQGHLVTCDLLCGVKVLQSDLGAVLFG